MARFPPGPFFFHDPDLVHFERVTTAVLKLKELHRRQYRKAMGPLLGDFVHGMKCMAIEEEAWNLHEAQKFQDNAARDQALPDDDNDE